MRNHLFLNQSSSTYDIVIVVLVSLHLLFSMSCAAYLLYFHLHSSSSARSLCRRFRLNSLLPVRLVRLLLLLFASFLSFSELFRLPLYRPRLCTAYYLSSLSFSQPAFFVTLLFLLQTSTQCKPSSSSSSSSSSLFISSLILSVSCSLPFLVLHSVFLSLPDSTVANLSLPPHFFTTSSPTLYSRCAHPLFGTLLQALFAAIYVPLFISACWNAVTVVINRKLRVRLYGLATVVAMALSAQVITLALASLWDPTSSVSQGLEMGAFLAVIVCVVVGELILVIQPITDGMAIVRLGRSTCDV